ncbi:hypothetical protein BS78_K077300 [Paspalum vaginatum]|uniref:Uncharacterized protein n=1 Tax=Paspalum vaginatum TaxID=158149 RepID=A0A9W7X9P9_9POAL|nr:hypothetical protein BS78_K077300 [Paspalum vaginatum]
MNAVITPPWNPTNAHSPRPIKGVRGLTSSLHSFPLTPLHSIPSALLSPRRRGFCCRSSSSPHRCYCYPLAGVSGRAIR